jgi:Tol biopolymer transport system component
MAMPRRRRIELGGRTRAALALLGSLAVLTAGGANAGTSAQTPPLLVFASDRAPDYYPEIYSLDVAGGARRDMSSDERTDQLVAVRGRQVVFESARSGAPALYVADLDSQAPLRMLLRLPAETADYGMSASWSPRGRELAVAVLRQSGGPSSLIEVVDSRSGRKLAQIENSRPVAPVLGLGMSEPGPSMWSADGRWLAYALGPTGQTRPVIRFADAHGHLRFSRRGDQALWAAAAPRVAVVAGPYGAGTTVVDDEQGREIGHFKGRAMALSPDGRTLVLARSQALWLASVDTGKLRRLANEQAQVVAFSPDGAHVEALPETGQMATIFGVASRRVEAQLNGFGEWFGDSRRLAVVTSPMAAAVTIATTGGRVLRRVPLQLSGGEIVEALFVTSDGKSFVYAGHSYSAHQLYEQLGTGALREITSGLMDHQAPAPSPDGKLIADAEFETPCGMCSPPEIAVLAADGSEPARVLPDQSVGNGHPSWSPDGARIAYGENAAPDILGIFVMHADGSQPVKLDQGSGGTDPAWAPDGSAVAATRDGIVVIASDDSSARQLTGPVPAGSATELTRAPAWSPDSASLAFAGADGLYAIGRAGDGLHRVAALPGIVAVAWSPDGMLIAFAAGCQGTTASCANDRTHDIWTVRPDGSDLRRVTDDVADDTTPAWLPAS